MKKIFPMAVLALAAIGAVSCSSDDDEKGLKDPTKDAISFNRPYVVNSVKDRAASANIDFDSFYVWGFVNYPDSYIFDKNKVTKNGSEWVVDKTEYWYTGQKYYFSAIAPVSEDIIFNPVTEAADNYTGGGTIQFDNSVNNGRTDLVYAFSGPISHETTSSITKVGLTFNHLLSRVMFTFTNNVSQATSLVIKNLTLQGVYANGIIDLNGTNTEWQPTGTLDITDIKADTKIANTEKVISESRLVIPTTENYAISFTVEVYNGKQLVAEYDHNVSLPEVTFEKGNSYNFNATFTSQNLNPETTLEPIKFTVDQVNSWVKNNVKTPVPGA
ncbi:MAG: fimbrillin family protein [Staphylococcus sp.]|nr:fimbrillin family protein [Staphylococcus sp.]